MMLGALLKNQVSLHRCFPIGSVAMVGILLRAVMP